MFQLNFGSQHLKQDSEKSTLINSNLQLGITAKESGAYASVIEYLTVARKLLHIDSWSKSQPMTFNIYRNLAECQYLIGEFEDANSLCDLILERILIKAEQAEIYALKVTQQTSLGRWEEANMEGFKGLALFDIDITQPTNWEALENRLDAHSSSELLDYPEMLDKEKVSTMMLLNSLISPIYFSQPQLMQNLVCTMIDLSLQFGSARETAYAYDAYGSILGALKGNHNNAHKFAKLGLQLNAKLNDIVLRCKIKLTFAANINPWRKPLNSSFIILEQGFVDGMNAGDILSAGYCLAVLLLEKFASGEKLEQIQKDIDKHHKYLVRTKNPVTILVDILQQNLLTLDAKTDHHLSLNSEAFNEMSVLKLLLENKFKHGQHWYYVNKMLLSVIYNEYSGVDEYIEGSFNALDGAAGQFSVADHNFYHSLILTGQFADFSQQNQANAKNDISENQKQLKIWSDYCPENFSHKYNLVEAEQLALQNQKEQALQHYQFAKTHAMDNGFIQDAAIATERMSKFYRDQGNIQTANELLNESATLYLEWSATLKYQMLKQ